MLGGINWNCCQKSSLFVADSPTLSINSLTDSFSNYLALLCILFLSSVWCFNSLYCFWPFLEFFFYDSSFLCTDILMIFLPSTIPSPLSPQIFIVLFHHFVFLVKSGKPRERRKAAAVCGLQIGQKSLSYFERKVIVILMICIRRSLNTSVLSKSFSQLWRTPNVMKKTKKT